MVRLQLAREGRSNFHHLSKGTQSTEEKFVSESRDYLHIRVFLEALKCCGLACWDVHTSGGSASYYCPDACYGQVRNLLCLLRGQLRVASNAKATVSSLAAPLKNKVLVHGDDMMTADIFEQSTK